MSRGWLDKPVVGQSAQFRVQVVDSGGQAVRGAEVTTSFLRFSSSAMDFVRQLDEIEPGVYQAGITVPQPGRWEINVDIRYEDDIHQLRGMTDIASQ